MNTFATILEVISFRKVTYYTIQIEGEDLDLFTDFVQRHTDDYKEQLDVIQTWLKKVGDDIGARANEFRFEAAYGGDARALPPRFISGTDLRLYCMLFDKHNVILFNGAIKTAETAQECDNVRPHFEMANRLSKAIHQAKIEGEITINETTERLEFDDDFEMMI